MTWPTPAHGAFLSSITSTELRKVVIRFAQGMEKWSSIIDKPLCGLVDRLRAAGYRRTLEVELRLAGMRGAFGVGDSATLLPKFREKGVVVIVDADDGRVLHSSSNSC